MKIGNRELRWMKGQDHKTSCGIANFANENSAAAIRLEDMQI
jgi:hypothetical protein